MSNANNNSNLVNRNVVLNALKRALAEVSALAQAPCKTKGAYQYRCAYAAGVAAMAGRLSERAAVDAEVDALTLALANGATALRTQTRFATR